MNNVKRTIQKMGNEQVKKQDGFAIGDVKAF
jgi:hypothetical protein